MEKPVIRIVRASTGHYLYKLISSPGVPNWRYRYYVLDIEYIFDNLKYFEE